MGKKIDLKGQRFGRLLVVKEAGRNKYKKVLWKCLCDCGTEIIVVSNNLKRNSTKSCGCLQKERASETHKGKIRSEETKKKMSKNHADFFGKNNPMFGKILSEDHKKKISKSMDGKYCGKNHPQYNFDLTDEERQDRREYPEYYEWRKQVFERDNYICQCCGQYSGSLRAHHLDNYRNNLELRTTLSNGITLCTECHNDFHHQYGYNCTKEQFEEFLKNRLEGLNNEKS